MKANTTGEGLDETTTNAVAYNSVGFMQKLGYPCYDPDRDPPSLMGLTAGSFWNKGGEIALRVDSLTDQEAIAVAGSKARAYAELRECETVTLSCGNSTWAEARDSTGLPIAASSMVNATPQVWRAASFSNCEHELGPARKPAKDLERWSTFLVRI